MNRHVPTVKPSEGWKVCPRCSLLKTPSDFHRSSTALDGLQSRCKECSSREVKVRRTKPDDGSCAFGSCERAAAVKGWCNAHYMQHRTGVVLRPIHAGSVQPIGFCEVCGRILPRHRVYNRTTCGSTCRRVVNAEKTRARNYGMTVEELRAVLAAGCTICGSDGDLHIDHDHRCCPERGRSCGRCVRSALCSGCNTGLGQFADDPERLRAAADYLETSR